MKHNYTFAAIIAVTLLFPTFDASGQSKIDLQSRIQIEEFRTSGVVSSSLLSELPAPGTLLVPQSVQNTSTVGTMPKKMAFVGLTDGYTAADLEAEGYEVLSDLGEIAIVYVYMNNVEQLAELPSVRQVQLSRKLKLSCDKAREAVGVNTVMNGFTVSDTQFQLDGTGVITAIYDGGVAPNHINFLDSEGNPRVKRILKYEEDANDDTSINIYDYNTPQQVAAFTTDDEAETHGTHTMGILAGSYKGTSIYRTVTPNAGYTAFTDSATVTGANPFYGVATGSDILVGCGTFEDAAIVHAAQQMAQQAFDATQPIVFSCSIGGSIGARDGSDYLSQAFGKLAEDYNLIPVFAAGNEGADKMSVRKTFTSTTDQLITCVTPLSGYSQAYSLVDFWSDSAEPFTLKLGCFSKPLFGSGTKKDLFTVDAADQSFNIASSSGTGVTQNSTLKSAFKSAQVIALSEVSEDNGRYHVLLLINYTRKTGYASNLLYITVTSNSGESVTGALNNYGEFTANSNISGSVDGNADYSISTMACHPDIISVGAYNSRGMWYQFNGSVYGQSGFAENAVASFSSYGATDDGRQLPTLLGPGTNIISSFSPYYLAKNVADKNTDAEQPGDMSGKATGSDGNTYYWGAMSGTSMATPFVAGSIALWLQADPSLDVNEIKDIIASTSTIDSSISSSPQRIGAGRINTLAGAIEVIKRRNLAGTIDIDTDTFAPFIEVTESSIGIAVPGATSICAELFDAMGRKVTGVNVNTDEAQICTSGIAAGVYILKVATPAESVARKISIH